MDNRDSRIRALQDMVHANQQKTEEIDAQYSQYHSQIQLQEKAIREYMKGLNEQDVELSSAKRNLNETEFNVFEFQMAQSRVRDLELQLD